MSRYVGLPEGAEVVDSPQYAGLPTGAEVLPETPERGLVGETVAGVKRGGLRALDMAGQVARAVDPVGGVDAVRGLGLKVSEYAKNREQQPDVAPSSYIDEHPILKAIPQGAEMLIPSVTVPVAAGLGLTAAGVSAPAAIVAGGLAGAAAFGTSQYQDTKERGIEAGLSPEAANVAGIKTGLIEAVGEGASNLLVGGLIGKLAKPAAAGAGTILKSLFSTPLKELPKKAAKTLGTVAAAEVLPEMGQAFWQATVERDAGIREADPTKEALQTIGPTLGLSLLLGGAVSGVNKMTKVMTQKALEKETVGEDVRRQAAANVHAALLTGEADGTVPTGSAANWLLNAEEAIKNKKSITLDDALLTSPEKPLEQLQEKLVEALTASLSDPATSPVDNLKKLTEVPGVAKQQEVTAPPPLRLPPRPQPKCCQKCRAWMDSKATECPHCGKSL